MEQVIKSARVELGAILKKYADERNLTAREVGNKTRSSAYDVARWWSGELCPTGEVWGRLIQHQGQLRNYRDLFQRARIEQDAEQAMDRLAARGAPVPPAIVTNLGDKLEVRPQVQVHPINVAHPPPTISPAPVPDNEIPEPDQTKSSARYAPYPGAYSYEKQQEKRKFARAKLLERPRISLKGRDGLNNLIVDRFGTGLSYDVMIQLRYEVHMELGLDRDYAVSRLSSTPTTEPQPATISPAMAVAPQEPTTDDVNAAVQLLMQAIPNLQSLTIIVDEHGEADVSYETRKVQIVTASNSIKVRR